MSGANWPSRWLTFTLVAQFNASRLLPYSSNWIIAERYFRRYTTVVSVSAGSGVGSP